MPARDGTGPFGQGRMAGRGFGRCATSDGPRFLSGRGRGIGLGLGLGLGCLRYLINANKNAENPESILKEREAMLERALSVVRKRIGRVRCTA
jgi:hypothetical protein